jgi:hypothetical protein
VDSEFPINELTDVAPEQPAAATDEWGQIFAGLRQRFAGASDGVLFCIHKLQQNHDLKLRDFKEEAALHRVPLSGRSYHSARVLLGLEKPTPPRPRRAAAEDVASEPLAEITQALADSANEGEDNPLIAALRRYQAETSAELERLRAGVRAALQVIDDVLQE